MKLKEIKSGFATRAIHAGQEPDAETGAVAAPIYPTSTYVQQELGKNKGYEYARVSNPTRTRLEKIWLRSRAALRRAGICQRHGGDQCHLHACSSPAITWFAAMICMAECRGLFNQVLTNYGLEFTYVNTTDPRNVERAIRKNTRMVYVETPTNPLMTVTDMRAISQICRRKKIELVVDNTFMSPYFQQPLALGADMVVHSTTKFLNGHSDGLGGAVVCTTTGTGGETSFRAESGGGHSLSI